MRHYGSALFEPYGTGGDTEAIGGFGKEERVYGQRFLTCTSVSLLLDLA